MSRVCAEPFLAAPPSGLPERPNKRIEVSGIGGFPNAPGESFEWLLAASPVGGTLASRLLPPSAQPGALTGGARQGPTRKASWPQLQDAGFARVSHRPRPPPCQAGTIQSQPLADVTTRAARSARPGCAFLDQGSSVLPRPSPFAGGLSSAGRRILARRSPLFVPSSPACDFTGLAGSQSPSRRAHDNSC
jgi:hypothetical protein